MISIVFILTYIILVCSWQLLHRRTVVRLRLQTNREPVVSLQDRQREQIISAQGLPALLPGCQRSQADLTLQYQRLRWWSLRYRKLPTRDQALLSQALTLRFQILSRLQYISLDQPLLQSSHQINPPALYRVIN